ncbi:MAG: Ig-like domain-containing protein [Candidatus Sericytochromatia bacterium]
MKLRFLITPFLLILTSCFINQNQTKITNPPKYILIEPSGVVLRAGEEKVLTAFVYMPNGDSDTSNKNIIWDSSERGILDIDEKGKIKAIRAGESSITAKFKDTDIVNRIVVSVIDKKIVDKIDVSPTELKLKVGESANVKATVNLTDGTKNSNIIWTSSDNTIAIVNEEGKVTAIKQGNASIVANYATDSRYKKSIDIIVN